MDRISALEDKLVLLRQLDLGLDVHGASSHRYKTHRLTKGHIKQIERRAGNTLPDELREWLTRVGFGAGPGYGLFRMGERKWFEGWPRLKGALGTWVDTPKEPPGIGEFASLSEIGAKDARQKIDETLGAERTARGFPESGPPKFTTKAVLGGPDVLTLAHEGCSFWYVTPLVGPLKGKVFFSTEETVEEVDGQDVEHSGLFWLQGIVRSDTHPWFEDAKAVLFDRVEDGFGFLDWMENWLDQELYFVKNIERYNAQIARRQAEWKEHFAKTKLESRQ